MTNPGSDELDRAIETFLDAFDDPDAVLELPPVSELPRLGATLGEFRIHRVIGRGAAGVVYEAEQTSVPGRSVALKVLHQSLLSPRARERFAREIRIAGRLDHPAVVPIVAAALESDPPWLAMRLVPGRPGGEFVDRLRDVGVPHAASDALRVGLGPEVGADPGTFADGDYVDWVARMGAELAEALAHAHAAGILHRDVKPWNLIITPEGRPVLIDLGLARGETDLELTRTGAFVGTLAYSSPEQLRGDPVGPRTDVYGLGATLYEFLELRRPYEASTRSALLAILEADQPPRFRPEIPQALRTIIRCALAPRAAYRYASATAMAQDLRRFAAGGPIAARPPGLVRRASAAARRHRRLIALGATLLLVFLVVGWERHLNIADRLERGDAAYDRAYRTHARWRDSFRVVAEQLAAPVGPSTDGTLVSRLSALAASERAAVSEAETYYRHALELGGNGGTIRRLRDLLAFRIRSGLRRYDDLFTPSTLRALEAELAERSPNDQQRRLLDHRGTATFSSAPSGARVTLVNPTREDRARNGTTPCRFDGLPEGSWIALVEAPGYVVAHYPFLVRRRACYDDPEALPPPDHHIDLVPECEAPRPHDLGRGPEDWTLVTGGWTLVRDDPPVWIRLDDFFIQTDETRYRDWIDVLDSGVFSAAQRDGIVGIPRYGPDALHLVSSPQARTRCDGRRFGPDIPADAREDVPVHGLTRREMRIYAQSLPGAPRGWIYSVPTRDEFVRAARGADARRFPWGDIFDWDATLGYYSRNLTRRDRWPLPLDSTTRDVSPFGVRHLAGSVAEICDEDAEPARDRVVVFGASFASSRPEDFSVLAHREVRNVLLDDVGVRAVMRRVPRWARSESGAPLPFSDDFERADRSELDSPWSEAVDWPPIPARKRGPFDWIRIHGGRLELRGGEGNGSRAAMAILDIATGQPVRRVTLDLRMSSRRGAAKSKYRGFGLSLIAAPLTPEERALTVHWCAGPEERVGIRYGGDMVYRPIPMLLDREVRLELDFAAGAARFRLWQRGAPRPATAQVIMPATGPFRADVIQLRADNLVGIEVDVDRIEVR